MIPLNTIQVPEPCGENWDAMDGDAQRRFCAGCGCHVHDLSAMTSRQAQTLLDSTEGRLCVRFQTSSDGKVMTQETAAPTERRVFWPRRLAAAASWVLALALAGLGLTARAETITGKTSHVTNPKPHAAPTGPKRPGVTLGKIAVPQHTLGQIAIIRPKPPTTTKPPTPKPPTIGAPAVPPPNPSATMGIVARPPKK